MNECKLPAKDCYLIDRKFCKIVQKRIAVIMGMAADIQDPEKAEKILNKLADIRYFFHWKELRCYSDNIKNSIDMERFVNPEKPIIQR